MKVLDCLYLFALNLSLEEELELLDLFLADEHFVVITAYHVDE